MKNTNNINNIGETPFNRLEMLSMIEEFEAIHSERPIKDNSGGMLSPHLFAVWAMARTLSPEVIIESGIWKGQSTWLLENACPEAEIHSIDLNLSKREYISSTANYYEEDFSELDWSGIDTNKTLVFFDDHQNVYTRLQHCKWFGIKDIIFEDNYPTGYGDFYTMKMIFSGKGFAYDASVSSGTEYKSFSAKLFRKLKSIRNKRRIKKGLIAASVIPQFTRDRIKPNTHDLDFIKQNVDIYAEFPPVFEKKGFPSPVPLLEESEAENHSSFSDERNGYNGICYVKLK